MKLSPAPRARVALLLCLIALFLPRAPFPAAADAGLTWRIDAADAPPWAASLSPSALTATGVDGVSVVYGGDRLYEAVYQGAITRVREVNAAAGYGAFAMRRGVYGNAIFAYDRINEEIRCEGCAAAVSARLAWPFGASTGEEGTWVAFTDERDGAFKAAAYDGSGWRVETVDPQGGGGAALRVVDFSHSDREDVDVVYGRGSLKHAEVSNAYPGWTVTTIDDADAVGMVALADRKMDARMGVAYTVRRADGLLQARYAEQANDGGWVVHVIEPDATVDTGLEPSLDFDYSNRPHVSYGSGAGLKVAVLDGGAWQVTTVDPTGGRSTSALISGYDPLRVAYLNDGQLKLAVEAAGGWTIHTLAELRQTGAGTSLALAADDAPRVSYRDATGAVRYAAKRGPAWATETVDPAPGLPTATALALDASGAAQIAYASYADEQSAGRLMLARQTAAGWQVEQLEAGLDPTAADGPARPGLAVTGDELRVAYGYPPGRVVRELALDASGGRRVIREIPTHAAVGPEVALALGRDGRDYLAYRESGDGGGLTLGMADASGRWTTRIVDPGAGVGRRASLAVDAAGGAHLCYEAATASGAELRYRDDAAGAMRVIATGPADAAFDCAIALNAGGAVHVSYYDPVAGDAVHALLQGDAWVKTVVDAAGDTGRAIALALGADGFPRISYRDVTNGDLRVALPDTADTNLTWQTERVGTHVGRPEGSVSIAMVAGNVPAVAYTYLCNYDGCIGYATQGADGAWTVTTVDDGRWARQVALAADPAGRPHMVYYTGYNNTGARFVNYATADTGGWRKEELPVGGLMGLPAIAVDGSGAPHLAWGGEQVYYARRVGAAWQIETVTPAALIGSFSLAVTRAGQPHLAHEDLYFRKTGDGAWTQEARWPGRSASIAVDALGRPSIAASGSSGLTYDRWTGTRWEQEIVDPAGSKYQYSAPALALDAAGRPHIAYTTDDNRLRYTMWTGSRWERYEVGETWESPGNVSLTLDAAGLPVIAYRRMDDDAIMVARADGVIAPLPPLEPPAQVWRAFLPVVGRE